MNDMIRPRKTKGRVKKRKRAFAINIIITVNPKWTKQNNKKQLNWYVNKNKSWATSTCKQERETAPRSHTSLAHIQIHTPDRHSLNLQHRQSLQNTHTNAPRHLQINNWLFCYFFLILLTLIIWMNNEQQWTDEGKGSMNQETSNRVKSCSGDEGWRMVRLSTDRKT